MTFSHTIGKAIRTPLGRTAIGMIGVSIFAACVWLAKAAGWV